MLLKNKLILISGLAILLAACGGGNRGEKVPITTSSEEARADYLTGLDYLNNIRVSEAREMFERALEKDPKFAMAHIFIIADGPGNAQAQKHMRKAVQLAPHVSKGEQLLIKAAKARFDGDLDSALELLEKLTDMYPDDERVHYQIGNVLYNGQHAKSAINSLKKAIAINENFAPAYNLLGYYYKDQGDFDKAEEALRKYSELLPKEANPYDSMGDLLVDKGELEEAIKYFIKSYKINPVFGISMRKAAINQVFLGRYEEARANYRTVYETEPSTRLKAEILWRIALSYIYEGKPAGAKPIIAEVLELANLSNSEFLMGQVNWGIALMSMFNGNLDEARSSLAIAKEIIASSPPDIVNENMLGGAKRALFFLEVFIDVRAGDLASASGLIDSFEATYNSDDDDAWKTTFAEAQGLVQFANADYDAALESFESPEKPTALSLFYQAKINLLQGNTGRGLELMRQVATRNSEYEDYYPFIRIEAIATLAEAE